MNTCPNNNTALQLPEKVFPYSLGSSVRDSYPRPGYLTWGQLCQWLSTPVVGVKDGQYFCCTHFEGNHRADDCRVGHHGEMFVLDGDKSVFPDGTTANGAPAPIATHAALNWLGIPHLLYTSYSHLDGEKGIRYRVVIPCHWETKSELTAVVGWVIRKMHGLGVFLSNVPENTDPARLWFSPRVAAARVNTFAFYRSDIGMFPRDEALKWWQTQGNLITQDRKVSSMNNGEVHEFAGVLGKLGMVLKNKGGKVDITCPWEHEHTKSEGTGAFIGVEGFKCHHTACRHRNMADIASWLEEEEPEMYAELMFGPPKTKEEQGVIKIEGRPQSGDRSNVRVGLTEGVEYDQ